MRLARPVGGVDGLGALADLLLLGLRSTARAPDDTALLVGHHEQQLPQRGRKVDVLARLLQVTDDPANLSLAALATRFVERDRKLSTPCSMALIGYA